MAGYDSNKYLNGPKKIGVPQYMNMWSRGGPQMSNVKGRTLEEAQALMPYGGYRMGGFDTSGVGPGTRGYRGSYYNGGYNYGEGTRGPSFGSSSEYYSTRDRVLGSPLDNLRRFGPGRAFGGSVAQKLAAEVRGSAASDPVWGSTMSGGPTAAPEGGQAPPAPITDAPYGTKIENGVEVPMTAEDLNKVRGSISSVAIPGVGRSEFAPERNAPSFRPPAASPFQPPPPINSGALSPQFLPGFMQVGAQPVSPQPGFTENSGIIPPQMIQSTFLPMRNADIPKSSSLLVTPWQKLNLEAYKAASNTVGAGRDWIRDKLNWLSRPQYSFTP